MKSNRIAIMGCGWMGFPLAKHLLSKGYLINGSTTNQDKIERLRTAGIQPYLLTANPDLEGTKLADFFNAKILILNIPPGRRRPDVEVFHPQQIKSVIHKAITHGIEKVIDNLGSHIHDLKCVIVGPGEISNEILDFLGRKIVKEFNIIEREIIIIGVIQCLF